MSVADLARQTGYGPLLLDDLIAGRTRQIPVDFFIRVAEALDLTMEEKRRPGAVLGIRNREAELAVDQCLTERSYTTNNTTTRNTSTAKTVDFG
jgi:hypothetical protein